MPRPSAHPKSGVYRLRVRVPAHLREIAGRLFGSRVELIETLRTKNLREAQRLAPAVLARLRGKLDDAEAALGGEPRRLTDQDAQTLAGLWYRHKSRRYGANPREVDWDGWRDSLDDGSGETREDVDATRARPGPGHMAQARDLLRGRGYLDDAETVERLARAILGAEAGLVEAMNRQAGGDYSPDPTAATFPTLLILRRLRGVVTLRSLRFPSQRLLSAPPRPVF